MATGPSVEYAQAIHQLFSTYYAGPLTKETYQLGDFGVLSQGVLYQRLGNITDNFEIKFDTRPEGGQSQIAFNSSSGVSFSSNDKGQAGAVNATIQITFSETNAIYFNAAGVSTTAIEDQVTLGDQILVLYKQGKWNKQYVVVTELVAADSTTVVMSSSKQASVTLQASDPAIVHINMADVTIDLEISVYNNLSIDLATSRGLTPFIGLSGVSGGGFLGGSPTFGHELLKLPMPADAKKVKLPGPFFGRIGA